MNEAVILKFLKEGYPIIRMRIDDNGHPSTKGKFKRVIKVDDYGMVYKLSDPTDRYKAMNSLSTTLCRVFYLNSDAVIPSIKKHLHIT
tara:strand:+ start:888 stop:1151 length:264 start_codon:yes stop_codon:yes gene_type:complete